jgi:hypothetical protein
MTARTKKILSALMVAVVGVWGCAQGTVGSSGEAERIKALEAKNARLLDDYRAAASARDQLRQKLAATEQLFAQARQEVEQLQETVKVCDELREQLAACTCERDIVQGQFEAFRTQIRQLLGQAEAAANQPIRPVVAAGSPQLTLHSEK